MSVISTCNQYLLNEALDKYYMDKYDERFMWLRSKVISPRKGGPYAYIKYYRIENQFTLKWCPKSILFIQKISNVISKYDRPYINYIKSKKIRDTN